MVGFDFAGAAAGSPDRPDLAGFATGFAPDGLAPAGVGSDALSAPPAGALDAPDGAAASAVAVVAGVGFGAPSSLGDAERESVLYQPDPLKTIAVAAMTRRGSLPQRAQTATGGSLNPPTAAKVWPQ